MAILFQDDYKACPTCGNKGFLVNPVHAIDLVSKTKVVTSIQLECSRCGHNEDIAKDYFNEQG